MKFICKLSCFCFALTAGALAETNIIVPLTSEIRNEQPYSLDNNAIRIRVFNHGKDTLNEMSFCYRFHAKGEFVFESEWYLPGLNYKIDSLADTTFQIHFWLKQGTSVAPNSYFPNTSGIVFGLHYKYWLPWEHQLDYSYSSSATFENTDKLFISTTDECYDDAVTIDSARVKILGHDRDGNGVRDDLDSLIDIKLPDSPEKRAAYRYLAKAIQNQWSAFYENPQMSYEELFSYEVYVVLGITLIGEVNAKEDLKWEFFQANVDNTLDRIRFDDKIDRAFVGKFIPVAVGRTKRYPEEVLKGRNEYYEMLKNERAK